MSFICGASDPIPVTLPKVGDGECCIDAMIDGAQACTCWRAVRDLEQQDPREGPSSVQPRPCSDCAYRGDSPERNGDGTYYGDWDDLVELAVSGEPFFCHSGMRRKATWRHPSGAEVDGHLGDYDPPVVNGVPRKADGSPADLCGGWWGRRRKWLREEARDGQ